MSFSPGVTVGAVTRCSGIPKSYVAVARSRTKADKDQLRSAHAIPIIGSLHIQDCSVHFGSGALTHGHARCLRKHIKRGRERLAYWKLNLFGLCNHDAIGKQQHCRVLVSGRWRDPERQYCEFRRVWWAHVFGPDRHEVHGCRQLHEGGSRQLLSSGDQPFGCSGERWDVHDVRRHVDDRWLQEHRLGARLVWFVVGNVFDLRRHVDDHLQWWVSGHDHSAVPTGVDRQACQRFAAGWLSNSGMRRS